MRWGYGPAARGADLPDTCIARLSAQSHRRFGQHLSRPRQRRPTMISICHRFGGQPTFPMSRRHEFETHDFYRSGCGHHSLALKESPMFTPFSERAAKGDGQMGKVTAYAGATDEHVGCGGGRIAAADPVLDVFADPARHRFNAKVAAPDVAEQARCRPAQQVRFAIAGRVEVVATLRQAGRQWRFPARRCRPRADPPRPLPGSAPRMALVARRNERTGCRRQGRRSNEGRLPAKVSDPPIPPFVKAVASPAGGR